MDIETLIGKQYNKEDLFSDAVDIYSTEIIAKAKTKENGDVVVRFESGKSARVLENGLLVGYSEIEKTT